PVIDKVVHSLQVQSIHYIRSPYPLGWGLAKFRISCVYIHILLLPHKGTDLSIGVASPRHPQATPLTSFWCLQEHTLPAGFALVNILAPSMGSFSQSLSRTPKHKPIPKSLPRSHSMPRSQRSRNGEESLIAPSTAAAMATR